MNIDSIRSCDVLIIGGGSAGLRAAIEAHDAGADVPIISKNKKGDPHTVLARGAHCHNGLGRISHKFGMIF